jgi:diguanylate cyclase (GGDEF)-like protein/PAS domain S-box-containing protein
MAGAEDLRRRAVDWHGVVMALEHGVVVVDDDGRVVTCNPAAAELLGRRASELCGRRPAEVELEFVAEDGAALPLEAQPSVMALRSGVVQRDLVLGVRHATGVRWLSVTASPMGADGRVTNVVLTLVDVSAARERELTLRRLSELDDLTGLPNRRRFVELLDRHLTSQRREDAGGALLLIDLDRFKELNDTFGHAAGDRLLVQVARAISERLRDDDVLARLGGDEFALLLKHVTASDAATVAHALVERLGRELAPAPHGGTRPVGASIGAVALAGAATGTAERALQRADASMYRAKAAGRATWRIDSDEGPGVGEELAKRSRQLALANALGARLAGMSDAQAIADATVEELRAAFGYHLTAVIRLRPDGHVEAAAVRGAHFDALWLRGWSQPQDVGLIGRCLRERTPILANDVHAEPDYEHTPETSDVQAELVVPLLVDGDIWGAINVEEVTPAAFDHEDVILLSTLANQVGAVLTAAALRDRLKDAEAAVDRLRASAG